MIFGMILAANLGTTITTNPPIYLDENGERFVGKATFKPAARCTWNAENIDRNKCDQDPQPIVKFEPGPKDKCLHSNDKEMVWRECK